MGKSLKGKELGVGISQRKDGLYTGRFTDRLGNRRQKYFKKLQECRKWIADAQFENEHGSISSPEMTVDAWYNYWIDEIKGKILRWSTVQNYNIRYEKNIKKIIGNMIIQDVRPMHCQHILNIMDNEGYTESSMKKTKMVLGALFSDAAENGIVSSSPVTKSVKCPKKKGKQARVLTLDEQKKFLDAAQESVNFDHFLFVLQTGVRLSELRGLRWEDVDFQNRMIHIRRNVLYDSNGNRFVVGELKTSSGLRDIPMTQTVYELLIRTREHAGERKTLSFGFSDHIFLNKNGNLSANSVYNTCLKGVCANAGIKKISMHTLRHTFATRCIESGMKPKTLQKILGHASISMTMDLYVHVTDDEKEKEIQKFERMCI